ncbi:MAG TPA: DUF4214 domain-containing protein [Pyrinomonadaceae bacterium]|nr:DUF4214 domain-containing protein [Pyrinomonadaceae bacterium]
MFRYFGIFTALSCVLLFVLPFQTPPPKPELGDVVISQIYTGGGTPGAAFQNSFIELFNRSSSTRDLSGVPITFTSATGAFTFSIAFVSSNAIPIGPGQHFLIQFGTSGPNGNPLPSPDGSIAQSLDPAGKVAVLKFGSVVPGGTCPLPNPNFLDFVGYGTVANCFEGSGPTANLANTTAALRLNNGCTDTNNNAGDFTAGTPNPRNTGSPATPCPASNPIDQTSFFVRQHYLDFLNREPDASGLAFWTNEIDQCGADAQCIEVKRINVSAAFFLSIEFQETGYLVYRFHKSGFGNLTNPPGAPVPVKFSDFLHDTQQIGNGVTVGAPGWEGVLEANKVAYAADFVQRPEFKAAYPDSFTADQFVTKLDTNAGGVLSATEKANLVAMLAVNPTDVTKRAATVRAVAEDTDLKNAEFNKAFVLAQYFGYLRRNPNDPPDHDFSGFQFWLNKLNQFNGNFVQAEMVKAFISSLEYRQRFGP